MHSYVANWSRHSAKVNFLLLFRDHILSVDADGNVFIWSFKGIEDNPAPIEHIKLDANFTPTCIMHPDTYLNKEGSLQLWNISAKKKLYEFKGWNLSICSCVSSPALDETVVGCADGTIHVHNILVTFKHSARGTITALSFSTDGQPILASRGSSGVISIWNLEKKRLQSVIREAHESSIISLHFFANEPVLMSSSADNSIKVSLAKGCES
ncbi:WD repeat-containing 36 [Gossypium australe]|uniref:WD repeat-containing 36 n=1 Tax=Gossypium australe TaxID=47621 RepID=A0A5B6WY72_9ROSI|nr:WD repeat-containing 36 [Gossypium australe]